MFHAAPTGCPGLLPGPPAVSIVVEDRWSEVAEVVPRDRFSPVRIAAGLEVGPVPPLPPARREYATPLLGASVVVDPPAAGTAAGRR